MEKLGINKEDKTKLELIKVKLEECGNLYKELSEPIQKYIAENCTNESLKGFGNFKSNIQDIIWEGRIIK